MQTMKNTKTAARTLFNALVESGITPIFDMDGIALDASHRINLYTQDHESLGLCTVEQIGQLNLSAYRVNSTHENIQQDKSLPLLDTIHMLNAANKPYHVCTARVVCSGTRKLFKDRGINPHILMSRDGEHDNRRDSHLKTTKILSKFDERQRSRLVLIDDSLGNCKAVKEIGVKAIHVPFEGF